MLKIINRPMAMALEEYDLALEQFISRASAVPGVYSIYTMGSVRAPGLSDLDVIVVVDDKFENKYSSALSTSDIDDRIFLHGPVVIPFSLVSKLQYIVYAAGLTLVHGEELLPSIDLLSDSELRPLRLAYLIDFQESRFWQFSEIQRTGIVDQRGWLTRLWSLTHSWDIAKELGLSLTQQCSETVESIKALRAQWMDDGSVPDQQFIGALESGEKLLKELFFVALLEVYGDESVQPVSSRRIANKCYRFRAGLDKPSINRRSLRLWAKPVVLNFIEHDSRYFHHLQQYNFWEVAEHDLAEFSPVFRLRAEIVKFHWRWLELHCRGASSMSGYLGARDSRGMGVSKFVDTLIYLVLIIVPGHLYKQPRN